MNTIETLAERLRPATERGKISWVTTPAEDSFAWSGPNATVLISRADGGNPDGWGNGGYTITIEVRDRDGGIVESGTYIPHDDEYSDMYALYELARRNAKGADKIINDLLAVIERLDPTPRGKDPWGKYSDDPPF